MPKGGGNTHGFNVILPEVSARVHELVNRHRKENGLPEWDFQKRPSEQWWKFEPLVNFLVNNVLKQVRAEKKYFNGWKFKQLEKKKI